MAQTKPPLPKITSLAAPTPEDMAALRALTPEQRRELVAEHLEQGRADIEAGRFTELDDEAAIDRFFDALWPAP
jgi:predicted transcriptional regulator